MKLNGCKETEPVEVSAEAQRPMMTSSVFAGHVRGVTPHNAKSTEILATDTMAHGTMEIGHGEVPPSFSTTNPQPRQARRWFRQAEADLAAVFNDINTSKPSYEWACFKCHQVSAQ